MRDLCRGLVLFGPFPDGIKVPARMLGVEVHIRFWRVTVPPYLAQHTYVDGTHELLTDDVEAVGDMVTDDVVVVLEGTFAQLVVIVIVVVEGLAE